MDLFPTGTKQQNSACQNKKFPLPTSCGAILIFESFESESGRWTSLITARAGRTARPLSVCPRG